MTSYSNQPRKTAAQSNMTRRNSIICITIIVAIIMASLAPLFMNRPSVILISERKTITFERPSGIFVALNENWSLAEIERDVREKKLDLRVPPEGGLTPLHVAVQQGKLDLVKYLIASGLDVNARGEQGWAEAGSTPLHMAIRSHNLQMVELLIRNGANPELPDRVGRNATDLAHEFDFPEALAAFNVPTTAHSTQN